MGNPHVPMPRAYSAKSAVPVLRSEYARLLVRSIFLRLTGFHLAGKCSGETPGEFGPAKLRIKAANPARCGRLRRAGLGMRESDSGLFSN